MWIAAFAGCISTGVSGLVHGDAVDVESAAYAEVPKVFGDDGAIFVYLLPGPDACGTVASWLAVNAVSRDPAELMAQWNATFPQEFWEVDLVLRVADPTASQSGKWLTGTAWNAQTEADGEAYAELTHNRTGRDEDFFAGVVPDPSAYYERWESELGLLQIHRHKPGESLSGVFTTEAADADDGAEQGKIAIRFAAERCADVEEILRQ